MKKTILIALLTVSCVSQADNCERPRNTFDSLYCARKIFFELDDALNQQYKELREKLDGHGKELLKAGQIAWIHDRDESCTNGNAVIVSCAVEKTRQRLQFLQDRNHECDSVGCMNGKL